MKTDSVSQCALKNRGADPMPRPRWAKTAEPDPDPKRHATRFSSEVGEVFLLRNATERLYIAASAANSAVTAKRSKSTVGHQVDMYGREVR